MKPARLSPADRRLILVSARMAVGADSSFRRAVRAALRAGVPLDRIRELVLQNYLFLGYPRAINALALLPAGTPPRPARSPRQPLRAWRRRGEKLCRRIYGRTYDRMIAQMRRYHPDLADWLVWEGYGKVLSRPRLPPHLRELCVLPVLAITGSLPQLRAHLHGAINVGATSAEVREAVGLGLRLVPAGSRSGVAAMIRPQALDGTAP